MNETPQRPNGAVRCVFSRERGLANEFWQTVRRPINRLLTLIHDDLVIAYRDFKIFRFEFDLKGFARILQIKQNADNAAKRDQ